VLHGRRGGTDKYVRELVAATHDDYRHYLLVTAHDHWQLFDMTGDVAVTYDFRSQRASAHDDWLGSLCSRLSVGLIHVHSLVDTGELAAMFERTAVPYCYTVWDMHLPCPTVPSHRQLRASTATRPPIPRCAIAAWRSSTTCGTSRSSRGGPVRRLSQEGDARVRAVAVGGGHAREVFPGSTIQVLATPDSARTG
jgi:hypothetical protein